MGDDLDELAEPAPPPSPTKVDITVAGHTVIVESCAALHEVADLALSLFHRTAPAARRSAVGYDTTGGFFERAEPYAEPALEAWDEGGGP